MKHDINGPSRLALRYHCPGSANLEREHPQDEDTKFSERGTALHTLTAAAVEGVAPPKVEYVLEEGDTNAVDWCVKESATLKECWPGALQKCEAEISMKDLGVEVANIDLLLVVPAETVVVADYKYGDMEVAHPQYNWQVKGYAWAAWNKYGAKEVVGIVLQPEIDEERRHKQHTFTVEEMEEIGQQIYTIVLKANAPDAPLVKGWWCTGLFCRNKLHCPLWQNAVLGLPRHLSIPEHLEALDPSKRTELYETLSSANKWSERAIEKVKEYVLNGGHIPGYEIGEGRKSRAWCDPATVAPQLRELAVDTGVDPNNLFDPEKLKSVSQIEEIFGKSAAMKEKMAPLVVTIPGKPTIKAAKKSG